MKAMKFVRSMFSLLLVIAILCSCAAFVFAEDGEKEKATCGDTHLDLETWHEGDGTHYAFCYACKTEIIGQQCVIETVDGKAPNCTTGGSATEACVGGINPVSGKIDHNAHTLNGGCEYSFTTELPASHDAYVNNGDGTHTISCTCSTSVNGSKEAHTFINGTCVHCGAANPGKLLDFKSGSPETSYQWNVSAGTASMDGGGNGFLNGTINGSDPYVDMNHDNVFKRLQYPIAKDDILQVRVKLALDGVDTSKARYGLYLGFAAGAEYWKEGGFYAMSTTESKASTDGYVILTLPLREYAYKVLQYIRIDFMEWQESKSFTGSYSIDYFYFGPKENAPDAVTSSQSTLLDFKEGSREVTRFVWTDTVSCTVNFNTKDEGYMEGTINGADPYVGMSNLNPAAALAHKVQENDLIKIRVKLALNETEPVGSRYGFYLGFGSGDAYWNGGLTYFTTKDYQTDKNGYVTVSAPIPEDRVGQTLLFVRVDFAEWNSATFTGSYSIDYIYIGSPCEAPNADHSWDAGSLTTAPTCTELGIRTYTCSGCKQTRTETVAATGHTPVTDAAVAPTCTAEGKTQGSHCSVCHAVLTAQTTVPALGHKMQYTPLDQKFHTVACLNCQDKTEEAHTFRDGVCVCGQEEAAAPTLLEGFSIKHTLNLASDIAVNFAVTKSQVADFDMNSVYLECTVGTYEGNTRTGEKTVTLLPVEQGTYYYFTFTGLNAVMMNDEITAVFHGTKDGVAYYSPEDVYSVATYAYSQLGKSSSSSAFKTLCVNLLRYGSKAQSYKSYRTNALADAKLTASQQSYLTDLSKVTFDSVNSISAEVSGSGVKWVGKTLNLESKVTIRYIVDLSAYTGNIADLTLRINYYDIDGVMRDLTLTNPQVYSADKKQYTFDFDGLLASELRQTVYAAVYSGNTRLTGVMQYSVSTYGSNKTGALLTLCQALQAYSDAAKDYFVNK